MSNRFTDKAEEALNNAVKVAEEHGHTYIGSEHILLSLCRITGSSASVILHKYGITAEKLKEAIKEYSGTGMKSSLTPKDMTPCSKKIVENSYRISVRYGALRIGSEHILLAILEERDSVGVKLLKYVSADLTAITDEVQTMLRTVERTVSKQPSKSNSSLRQYGKSLTDAAKEGKLDPVIGREKETDRLIRILARKNKNNPCLIGDAGVGKTAIVEGLAQKIAKGNVPPILYEKEIICIDLTSIVSGAKYRGDFEERIKSVLKEGAENPNIILFIDEIHTIVGAGSAEGAIDAANILKPQLSRGEIQLIGATTFNEYHKYIEKDAALERRFQPIIINEPTKNEAINILKGVRKKYEEHHNVNISDEAIEAAVKLSMRYIQGRYLPDKALDILDEACAKVGSKDAIHNIKGDNFKQKEKEHNIPLNIKKEDCYNRIEFDFDDTEIEGTKMTPRDLLIGEHDVREIINEITGIPMAGIGETADPEFLRASLSKRVIGQESAVKSLVGAVMRSESGITNPEKPKGVFLFVGSSGVGKTELAHALADTLFANTASFISFDMSEYSEKNSVTKLIGSPPGYVGFEDGGILTEKVRRYPYSVILFDEIEKAHPEVIDLFLQITDTGTIRDSSGRSISFRNSYVIFTSNLISSSRKEKKLGFVSEPIKKGDYFDRDELSQHLRVEFLNRIDEIIEFDEIAHSAIIKIAESKLEKLKERLSELEVTISFDEDVVNFIAENSMVRKYGVRDLIRTITNSIENPVTDIILNKHGSKRIRVSVRDGTLSFKADELSSIYQR